MVIDKIYGWTPMIRMSDMRYPVYLADYRAEYPNVSIGSFVYAVGMAEVGYHAVYDVPMPQGDVVTEGLPELREDGFWYRTWNVRDFTEQEIADNLIREKEQRINEARMVLDNERSEGVFVSGKRYQSDAQAFTYYSSISAVAKDSPEGVFHLVTSDNQVEEFFGDDVIVHIKEIQKVNAKIYDEFAKIVKVIREAKSPEEIPQVPPSFQNI
ncbi:hypothetical protein A71_111 [Escherichia phage A7_1]|uniref:Uncharacterized protein n=2 Tax=Vequintavirinae TaxID=1911928 RepID=A0AAF0APV0_9CAUD|nr:hypothetical protein A71_111 [Escherichia phage A7_1]UZZ64189.1 hypothetical protein A54_225 [Escherichia phage A5-4]WBF77546.1 hypothetical protein A73_144 [Escherichia phage A73]WBF77810.1 hypothetical protein W70_130 [Escherichia phage W70]